MPKSPQIPEKRINVSLPNGEGEQLIRIRNKLEKERLGLHLSWAEVIRYAIAYTDQNLK